MSLFIYLAVLQLLMCIHYKMCYESAVFNAAENGRTFRSICGIGSKEGRNNE